MQNLSPIGQVLSELWAKEHWNYCMLLFATFCRKIRLILGHNSESTGPIWLKFCMCTFKCDALQLATFWSRSENPNFWSLKNLFSKSFSKLFLQSQVSSLIFRATVLIKNIFQKNPKIQKNFQKNSNFAQGGF